MTNMQHYMEDIQDILEGLDTEMERRFKRIGKWDAQIMEWNAESKTLEDFVFDKSNDREKRAQKAIELGELRAKMRNLTERKAALTEKNQKTVEAIYKKITELAYHCKCEVEIDNPGCTEIRERLFCSVVGGSAQLEADHADGAIHISSNMASGTRTRELSMLRDDDDAASVRSSASNNKERKRGPGRARGITKSSALSSTRSSVDREIPSKKGMSKYMRKKHEKIQQQAKLEAEQLANRKAREAAEAAAAVKASHVKEEAMDFQWDAHGNASGVEDDEQELLDFLPSFEGLPSPPREIMETLDMSDTGMFSSGLNFGTKNEAAFNASSQSGPYNQPNPNKRHASPSFASPCTVDHVEKQRKRHATAAPSAPLFGSIADTSFSGRPRKLTDRASEMVQCSREREERRRVKIETDDWCICDGNVQSEMMIACDNGNCKIEWFHFECVGLHESPKGEWFCKECAQTPAHQRTVRRRDD